MVAKLKWRGAELLKMGETAIAAGLQAATFDLYAIARAKASIPNIRVSKKRKRDTSPQGGGKKGSQYATYPYSSIPGESPRMRTKRGRDNIVQGFSRALMLGRVGYTRLARYMTFHELGIRYRQKGLQQRPTIVPAYHDNEGRLFAIAKAAALKKVHR